MYVAFEEITLSYHSINAKFLFPSLPVCDWWKSLKEFHRGWLHLRSRTFPAAKIPDFIFPLSLLTPRRIPNMKYQLLCRLGRQDTYRIIPSASNARSWESGSQENSTCLHNDEKKAFVLQWKRTNLLNQSLSWCLSSTAWRDLSWGTNSAFSLSRPAQKNDH